MKILFLTQYYPPEIGAPQNRLHELAIRIQANGIKVEVLTAMPNYPKMEIFSDYKHSQIKEEIIDGIKVYRSWIFVSKSKGIIARLLNYFSFVWSSYWKGRKLKKYDYLLVESPPLFLGYSAIALSRKLNAKLIFNVSDLWPESAEKLEIVTNKIMLNFAYNLERKCYLKSYLITGQTQGIVDDIKRRFPGKNVHWLPNGVDLDYYNPEKYETKTFREDNGFKANDLLCFYGGIIGHAQGLETLLYAANELRSESDIQIIIQGAGPEKTKLEVLKKELNLVNVHFFDSVSKNEMPFILMDIDVALIPLKKLELFKGAIPSKIFEALAMEKMLLLGVQGEAKKHFIDSANAGISFEPENFKDLAEKILAVNHDRSLILQYGQNGRKYVNKYFNRNRIASEFINVLKK